jgi:hypothetical protein
MSSRDIRTWLRPLPAAKLGPGPDPGYLDVAAPAAPAIFAPKQVDTENATTAVSIRAFSTRAMLCPVPKQLQQPPVSQSWLPWVW